MKLDEQVVVVTGGGGGIGRHVVDDLHDRVRTLIVIDRDAAALAAVRDRYPAVVTHACDLTVYDDVVATVEAIAAEHAVSVLVNNAGYIYSEPLVNMMARPDMKHRLETWHRTIDANLHSVFYVTSCVVEQMVKRRTRGVVITMSSISAQGNAGQSAYSAAKAAVNALTVTWSKELGMFGIRTAAIAPGFIDTPSTRRSLSTANLEKWVKQTPLGRLGAMDDIAASIRYIVENDFFTGRVLDVDGGLRI